MVLLDCISDAFSELFVTLLNLTGIS